ncbi:MAG: YwiC-like family protein [Terriglobales bacterium]
MAVVALRTPQTSRMRLLVFPREHGAWGILLVPLATGAAVGFTVASGRPFHLLLFTIAALALFCLRTPVESLLGTTPMRANSPAERRKVILVAAAFAGVALLAINALLWNGQNLGLLPLGAVAAVLFAAQTFVRGMGRNARTASQLIGALGLTSTAAAAYYVVAGQFDTRALALWLANWLFAANQVHFVQLRIHGARLVNFDQKFAHASAFFFGQFGMMVVVAAAACTGHLPLLAVFAFLPVFVRGLLWFFSGPGPLRVHRLGITELSHAIAFGVLLALSFNFASY